MDKLKQMKSKEQVELEKRLCELEKRVAELEASQARQKSIDVESLSKQIYSEISKIRDNMQ